MSASRVALLTGGGDKPYATGLATSLSARQIPLDFIGSDDLDIPEIRQLPGLRFLNLRGSQRSDAPALSKATRVLRYYLRLIVYAAGARPSVFHLLWNNKFEFFDRTVLMLYYRLLGKRIVLTVHNVNIAQRDGGDGPINRLTLRMQYALAHHLFVHTDDMRRQLHAEYGVPVDKVTTIPFGINSTAPTTGLTRRQARELLGLANDAPVVLFFGNIARYKGLEYAIEALARLVTVRPAARLLIAGRPKSADNYWSSILETIDRLGLQHHVMQCTSTYVPDEEIERYFKAADILVLPYTHVFQSGVLFLSYHFGLPAIVSDVGAMKHNVVEGVTGLVCRPADATHLAEKLGEYFQSPLYRELETRRAEIRSLTSSRNSWERVSDDTCRVYRSLWVHADREALGDVRA